jgi:RNA polymerase sigma-70 factor (ECF subfamily)
MDEESMETLRLVILAQRGDKDAFGQLVKRTEQTVHAIVLRRLRNQSEALEVTQDVFMQVMRKLPQLREPERFLGWVRRIAVRMAINRAVRRPREVCGDSDLLGAVGAAPDNPLETMLRNEDADQLRHGLSRLRELDRQTLLAFYFEGQSLQEMSRDFDSPVGTIKRRLHMARNRLRDTLAECQLVG